MLRLDFNLVLTMINLVIFFLLMRHFLIKPVTAIMEKRRKMIEDSIKSAEEEKARALELKKQYEAALDGAKEESVKLVEKARQDAKSEYGRIVKDADLEASDILKSARETIDVEREQTVRQMKNQVAFLAMEAAKKLLTEQCNDKENQALYDHFLEEAGDLHDKG